MLIHTTYELGLRIRDQRLDLGMTQAALAQRIGVARSWVIRVERGKGGTEIGLVLKAFNALGLDMDVRPRNAPAEARTSGGDSWTPDLADILKRARGMKR